MHLLHRTFWIKGTASSSSVSESSVRFRLGTAFKQLPRELMFRLDQLVDFFSTVPLQTNLWTSTFLLSDAEGAVGGLILNGRISAVNVDHYATPPSG